MNQGVFPKKQMVGPGLSKPTFLTQSIDKRMTELIIICARPGGPKTSTLAAMACGRRHGMMRYTFPWILRSFRPIRRNSRRPLGDVAGLTTRNGMMSALTACRKFFEKFQRLAAFFRGQPIA